MAIFIMVAYISFAVLLYFVYFFRDTGIFFSTFDVSCESCAKISIVKKCTCKFDVKLVLWSEYLNILWTLRSKVFDGPRSQYGMLILK